MVVGPSVVASADTPPGLPERLADALDFLREETRELQEAERVEIGQLLLSQLHVRTSRVGAVLASGRALSERLDQSHDLILGVEGRD